MVHRLAGSLSSSRARARGILAVLLGLLVPVLMTFPVALLGLEYPTTFLFLYLPATLLVAYWTGLAAGVVASLVSTMLAAVLFVDPVGWTLESLRLKWLPLLMFFFTGILLAEVGAQARLSRGRLERDLRDTRGEEQREALLVEISDLLMSRAPLADWAEAVCQRCASLLGDWCALVVLDQESGGPTLAALRPPGESGRDDRRRALERQWLPGNDPLHDRLVSGPLTIGTDRSSATDGPDLGLASLGFRGVLGAPLRSGEERFGYLAVFLEGERHWEEEDGRLLQGVADRVALAIQQERLRQHRRRRERDTQFQADLMVEFARQQDLSGLLEVVARRCTESLGEWCGIQLIDPANEWLQLAALHHRDPAKVRRLQLILERAPLRRDHPLVQGVLASVTPTVITPADPLVRSVIRETPVLEHAYASLQVRTTLAVPIYIRDEAVGILTIGAETDRRWAEDDLRLAALVADRTGGAIERARLVEAERRARENAERETRRLNAVNRVISIAASSLDLGAVFDEFAESLQLLLPFVRVTVSLHEPERDWLTMPYFKGPPLSAPAASLEGPKAGTVRGFVVDTGQPYVRADTLETQEFSEDRLLGAAGIRSYAVVPMTVGGRTIGTLNFGHYEPGFYTLEHARLVQPIADQLGLTISRFHLFAQAQRRAGELSETLQRALLPADLPRVPFAAIGALYRPADPEVKIGGDWYDAFLLPDDRVLISIGDVAGHGLAAAATTGQVRHVVRAYALEGRTSGAILTAVNRLVSLLPGETQLSMWIGIFDPYSGEIVYGSAGHPPPYVLDGEGVHLLGAAEPPLGMAEGTSYVDRRAVLSPGTRLVTYTDGLIETTRDVLEGERQLTDALQATATLPPASAVEQVVQLVVQDAAPHDDIAVLVVDVLPADAPLFLSVPAVPQNLRRIRRAVRAFAARNTISPEKTEEVLAAVGEAALNVVEHAYGGMPGMLTVQGECRADRLTISVRDSGRWRPQVERGRGRGTRIMQGLADSLRTHTGPAGTMVELSWIVQPAAARAPGAAGP